MADLEQGSKTVYNVLLTMLVLGSTTVKNSVLHPMHTEPGDPHRLLQPRITGSSFTSPLHICPPSSTWTAVNHPVSSLACSHVSNAQCSCGYVQKCVLKHACVHSSAFACGCMYTVHMDMCGCVCRYVSMCVGVYKCVCMCMMHKWRPEIDIRGLPPLISTLFFNY